LKTTRPDGLVAPVLVERGGDVAHTMAIVTEYGGRAGTTSSLLFLLLSD